jgi:hypothetical protein
MIATEMPPVEMIIFPFSFMKYFGKYFFSLKTSTIRTQIYRTKKRVNSAIIECLKKSLHFEPLRGYIETFSPIMHATKNATTNI